MISSVSFGNGIGVKGGTIKPPKMVRIFSRDASGKVMGGGLITEKAAQNYPGKSGSPNYRYFYMPESATLEKAQQADVEIEREAPKSIAAIVRKCQDLGVTLVY